MIRKPVDHRCVWWMKFTKLQRCIKSLSKTYTGGLLALTIFYVVVNGKSRKMRPFWDAECLRSGESWEVGFCNAICRSSLIVAVMSRNALANVEHLEPHSACDNVILEYALALALVIWHPLHAWRGLGLSWSDSCADLLCDLLRQQLADCCFGFSQITYTRLSHL